MTLSLVFLIAALIVFILATIPVASRINLVALGLALSVLAIVWERLAF